jgi:hypothetical protein
MLTVIISTSDETENSFLWDSLAYLNNQSEIETIVAINQKHNNKTYGDISKAYKNIRIIDVESNSRAARLNTGLRNSTNNLILYQHPRSYLEPAAFQYLIKQGQDIPWGAFQHQFDFSHPILEFTSWYSNQIRFKKSKIAYLDHCIFINKNFFEEEDILIPEVDIFEDTILSQQLSKKHYPKYLPFTSMTSSIRFKKNGILKQSAMNQMLKLGYYLGIDHKKMNKLYEKGLSLNSKYTKK